MKQVLLAIDGEVPSRPVFKYAADLCRQIRAELCVLQFAPGEKETGPLIPSATSSLKKMLETPECKVPVSVDSSPGSLENDLSRYVESHHDIVLTVYDPSQDSPGSRPGLSKRLNRLKDKLGVPLVVIKKT